MTDANQLQFRKGETLYSTGDFDANMYHILFGSVAIYTDYGKASEQKVVELQEGDFLNVISFLEALPRNTTAVALEPTVVNVISLQNFEEFFRRYPAKIMDLLQHMSARIRYLQKAYLETCDALKANVAKEKLQEDEDFYDKHSRMYRWVQSMFPGLEEMQ